MKRPLLMIIISLALIVSQPRPSWGQTPSTNPPLSPQAEQIKKQVEKIGLGNHLTVILPSGDEYYGTITNLDATAFALAEVDLKQTITLNYGEVKKVLKGYGGKNYITGKRVHPRRSLIVGLAVVGGLLGLVLLAASQTR
jgi:hypothetical protein